MGGWIDFRELRSKLNFAAVLRYYNVEVKVKGKGHQHHGYCPLPNHDGKKNFPSFSANLQKNIFHCFGCGAQGNILEFAALMEGVSVDNGVELRKVALKLRDKFCPEMEASRRKKASVQEKEPEQTEFANTGEKPVVVNAPLNFELKNLDPKHPYLDKRGFTSETIAHFGLGFCTKGLLANRIAIPIHNQESKLIGYCGRVVDDTLITEENPRYKFPPQREHKGIIYEFHKTKLLYNSHRLKSPVQDLALVEGFASVWWLTQMGFPNVGALMGWSMNEEQAQIVCEIVPASGRLWMITDGDDAGKRCAISVMEHISPVRSLRWLKLDKGKQPTDYSGGWYRDKLR